MSPLANLPPTFRTAVLAAAWALLILVLWGTDLYVKISERNLAGFGKSDFRLIVEQVTSGLGVLAMIPFVVIWLKILPPARDRIAPFIIGHTAGTAFFAFGHYALMVLMRAIWYGATGNSYVWREPFVQNLIVEYQKDLKIYLGIVVIVTAWRALLRDDRHEAQPADSQPDRLVVQTGTGTGVVRLEEIRYLEAARNYVAVHTENREFLVRDTLTGLTDRLDTRFLRVHRSFVVNVDYIRELKQVDSSTRIILDNGRDTPLSRSYRDAVTAALGR